ncbi:MAG: hypothetical protein FWG68_00410 [Defluviitaleaceae bacterium]|nr:hypothetical protein [Defluviitaleaceae bacterium]
MNTIQILNMSWASRRHNKLSEFLGSAFSGFFRQKIVKDEVFFSQGGTRLAHYGNKFVSPCYLVDISEVQDREYFVSDILTELESLEPDVMLYARDDSPHIFYTISQYFLRGDLRL